VHNEEATQFNCKGCARVFKRKKTLQGHEARCEAWRVEEVKAFSHFEREERSFFKARCQKG